MFLEWKLTGDFKSRLRADDIILQADTSDGAIILGFNVDDNHISVHKCDPLVSP
jgi:hypothetical protein